MTTILCNTYPGNYSGYIVNPMAWRVSTSLVPTNRPGNEARLLHTTTKHLNRSSVYRVSYRIFCWGGGGGGGGGKYTRWPRVLGSLAQPPAQGAGFPSTPAGPRCWVP